MNYRIINADGDLVELPVHVSAADDYHEIYAHGAQGGFLANYHFRIDFYRDDVPPRAFTASEGGLTVDSPEGGIERKIFTSVYLPLPFLKQLRNWLDQNITDFETEHGEIQLLKIAEAENAEEPQRKEA